MTLCLCYEIHLQPFLVKTSPKASFQQKSVLHYSPCPWCPHGHQPHAEPPYTVFDETFRLMVYNIADCKLCTSHGLQITPLPVTVVDLRKNHIMQRSTFYLQDNILSFHTYSLPPRLIPSQHPLRHYITVHSTLWTKSATQNRSLCAPRFINDHTCSKNWVIY